MALFHFHVTQIKRSTGQSAVASAAYRAGEKLHSEYYGEDSDYTKKGGVICSEILLPSHAPPEYSDRETLWNAVEKGERGKNAQLAYSFDIALQNELSLDENIALTRQFLSEQFVSRGMIVDYAIHQPEKDGISNPHFHVMCPIRPLKEDGTWDAKQHREYLLDEAGNPLLDDAGHQKFNAVPTTDWGTPETLDAWRKAWADLCNAKFAEKNLDCRIDNRSYKKQDVDLIPTVHEGPAVREMEKRGIRTDKGDHNRLIRQINAALKDLKSKLKALVTWIADLKAELSKPPEPTVYDLLNVALQRRNEGAWSFVARSKNLQSSSKLVAYLQQHGITTVSDLEAHIQDVSAQSEPVKTKLNAVRESMKQIDDVLKAGERYEKLKPVFDEYSKKFFKKSKDSFYAEHEKELKSFYAVRRKLKDYLDDNGIFHAGKLEKRRDTLEKEFDHINEENAPLKEQIATLNAIRKAITQAKADSSENRGYNPISEPQNVQKEPQHEQPQPKKKHELEI